MFISRRSGVRQRPPSDPTGKLRRRRRLRVSPAAALAAVLDRHRDILPAGLWNDGQRPDSYRRHGQRPQEQSLRDRADPPDHEPVLHVRGYGLRRRIGRARRRDGLWPDPANRAARKVRLPLRAFLRRLPSSRRFVPVGSGGDARWPVPPLDRSGQARAIPAGRPSIRLSGAFAAGDFLYLRAVLCGRHGRPVGRLDLRRGHWRGRHLFAGRHCAGHARPGADRRSLGPLRPLHVRHRHPVLDCCRRLPASSCSTASSAWPWARLRCRRPIPSTDIGVRLVA